MLMASMKREDHARVLDLQQLDSVQRKSNETSRAKGLQACKNKGVCGSNMSPSLQYSGRNQTNMRMKEGV